TSLEGAAAVTGGIGIGLGSLNLTAAAILSTGHGDENAGPEPDRQGFANQLEAGSGVAVYVRLAILRFRPYGRRPRAPLERTVVACRARRTATGPARAARRAALRGPRAVVGPGRSHRADR